MILTAHQPQYLPGLRLFAKIAKADVFAIFDVAQFERHSWENRNMILTNSGPLMLTVPLELEEHFKAKASDVLIAQGNWRRKHVRSIELAYQKAPFFNKYFPRIRDIIMYKHERLHGLNNVLLIHLMFALGIKTRIELASCYAPTGTKSELVLDLCRKIGATHYIFGSQGRCYADLDAFAKAGVAVSFQDYQYPVYEQLHGSEFVPNLSVIDLLFNHGPRSLEILMSGN